MGKITYKDGKLDGPYEWYYSNGRLEKKCTFKDGDINPPDESAINSFFTDNAFLNELKSLFPHFGVR